MVLQKQINLHVHDIERFQGFVSTLARKKGENVEELRRNKAKARKTMKCLKQARTVEKTSNTGAGAGNTMKKTAGANVMSSRGVGGAGSSIGKTGAVGGNSSDAFVEGSAVEILLFGFKKSNNIMSTSFNQSASTDSASGYAHVSEALKWIIANQNILRFAISTVGSDGRRIYTIENMNAAGGIAKVPQEVSLQTKI